MWCHRRGKMEKLSEEDAMNKYFDGSLTIRYAQKNQPWTVPYAEWTRREQSPSGFRCIFMGRHALLHAMKSVGKIAAEFEAVEHEDDGSTHGRTLSDAAIRRVADMAADLVTAA